MKNKLISFINTARGAHTRVKCSLRAEWDMGGFGGGVRV